MTRIESRMRTHAAVSGAGAGSAYATHYSAFTLSRGNQCYRVGAGTAGILKGDVYVKDVYESKHLLRSPRGWAFDKVSVENARKRGATRIDVRDKETGKVYRCSVSEFFRLAIEINRGYGIQLVLPLEYWKVVSLGEPEQSTLWPAGGER